MNLGKEVPYEWAFGLQKKLVELRGAGKIPDTFLLLEHRKVITVGNNGKEANILLPEGILQQQGYDLARINRGGDVTYHGPGQLVCYFIFDIYSYGTGVRDFFHSLEEIFVRLLSREYGLPAHREEEFPGVWVGEEKITALGCAIKRGISMHGFGFNVNTRLEDFQAITPCGIQGRGVTSLEALLGAPQDMEEARQKLLEAIMEVFGITLIPRERDQWLGEIEQWHKESLNG